MVIEKYTSYSKKRSKKELHSSQCVTDDYLKPGKPPVAKLRKSRDVDETAEVKITSLKPGKARMIKGKKDTHSNGRSSSVNVNSNSRSDQLSSKNKTSQKVLKFSSTVQSI